jgi:hypothetical protein
VKRFWIVVMCVLLAAGPVPMVFGQAGGAVGVNCNGLSDADCQILKDSAAAMQNVHSFAVPAWALDLNMAAGQDSVKFAANGHGAAVLPPSMMGLMGELRGLSDYTDLNAIISVYQQLNSDMVRQALSELGLSIGIEHLELHAPGQSMAASADVIYKDEGLYFRLEAPNGAEAWFGEIFSPEAMGLADLDASIANLIGQLQSEDFRQTWAQMSELSGQSQAFNDLASKHVTTTRGADTEMMGQTMRVFTTAFDLKGLLNDPDLPGVIMDLINNPALSQLGANPGDLQSINETQVQFLLMTLGLVLKEASFTSEQWIGADDQHVHKLDMAASLYLDLSLMGTQAQVEAVDISASFSVDLTDFDEDVMSGVEIPAEYHSLDDMNNFLVGGPEMIEHELQLGQTFAASLSEKNDYQDIYSLALDAGQAAYIELTSKDYPYLSLYGPDGFLIEKFDTYDTASMAFTADQAGTYLIVVEAYWEMEYDITIRAQQ